MVGKSFCWAVLALLGVIGPVWAQDDPLEASPSASTPSVTPTAPANSSLQREYARLAQLLNSEDHFGKREAAQTFLRVRPSDVANPETRKLIARGYRSLALERRGGSEEEAIQGLVIWAGKYSVPVLIELMENEKLGVSEQVFIGLGKLKDPRGAEAAVRFLGNFFNHDMAVKSLRNMGAVAEDALIKAAPSNDAKVSLAAVTLLGEVGTDKSLPLLQKASGSKNIDIKMAAREAAKRIRDRKKPGATTTPQEVPDANSPFAEGAGPAVDVTARNSRDYQRKRQRERAREAPHGFGAGGTSGAGGTTETNEMDEFGSAEEELVEEKNEGDWANVNALLPGDPASAGAPLDPSPVALDSKWRPQPTALKKVSNVHERPAGMAIGGGDSPIAVVTYHDPFNKSIGRMDIVNLKNRKSLGSTNVLGGTSWCALTPKAKRVLLVGAGDGHNEKSRLTVMDLNGAKATEVVTWWPYGSSESWNSNVSWAEWLDEEQFLTFNGEGMLVLWKMNGITPSAVYQIDGANGSEPALSPGRKHVAMATPRGVEIFRATDGEILARMGDASPRSGKLAFSENGGHLACVSQKSVYVWDATAGKLQRDFDCNALQGSGSVSWLDGKHLLVGGSDIVDLPKRLVLWRYESGPDISAPYGGWQWMIMSSGDTQGIVPAKLLTEEVLAADASLDANAILALKPGAKVALDVQLGGEEQAKAEEALRAGLAQSGMEVASDSPLRLAARIVTGKTETQEYSRGFSRFDRTNVEQVTVTEKSYEVELSVDGQSVWKQTSMLQSGFTPSIIHMQQGETAQQAFDRQSSQWSSRMSFGASLPRYVVHPKYAGPLGTSKLTLGGQ